MNFAALLRQENAASLVFVYGPPPELRHGEERRRKILLRKASGSCGCSLVAGLVVGLRPSMPDTSHKALEDIEDEIARTAEALEK